MNLITILVVSLLIPVAIYSANKTLLAGKYKNISISVASAIFVYVFILLSVAYVEYKFDAELAAFDLNGDGVFSGSEITPEQENALYRVTADTSRTFAPFTGAIFSLLYFFGVWLVLSIVSWVGNRRASNNT